MPRLNVNLTKEEYDFLKTRSLSISAWIRWVINEGIRLEKDSKVSASVSVPKKE